MDSAHIYDILLSVRSEISRINESAGETVFNPTTTGLLEEVIKSIRPLVLSQILKGVDADHETLGIPSSEYNEVMEALADEQDKYREEVVPEMGNDGDQIQPEDCDTDSVHNE